MTSIFNSQRTRRDALVASFLAVALAGGGCYSQPRVPAGAPRLLGYELTAPDGTAVSLESDAGPVLVPPLVHVVAIFDRLLDPAPLEAPGPDGPAPQPGVASIEATGSPMASTRYVPNGHHELFRYLPPGPRLEIEASPTYPSGSTVTIRLDPAKVRSRDGSTPFTTPESVPMALTFMTAPFAATLELVEEEPAEIDAGSGAPDAAADLDTSVDAGLPDAGGSLGQDAASAPDVDAAADAGALPDGGADGPGSAPSMADAMPAPSGHPRSVVEIVLNNLPAADLGSQVETRAVDATGAPLPLPPPALADVPADPTRLRVRPPGGGWPAGATVTVTVGPRARDALGVAIGAPATLSFHVGMSP
jgi:hypothetical protein